MKPISDKVDVTIAGVSHQGRKSESERRGKVNSKQEVHNKSDNMHDKT